MMAAHHWILAGVVGVALVLTWEFISTFRQRWCTDRIDHLRRKFGVRGTYEENAAQRIVAEHQILWRFTMGVGAALCWWGVVFMLLRK